MHHCLTAYLIKLNGAMKKRCDHYATFNRDRELMAYLAALTDAGIIQPDGVEMLAAYFKEKARLDPAPGKEKA